jgi:uncharacterized protein YgiB involved in biofilm formation
LLFCAAAENDDKPRMNAKRTRLRLTTLKQSSVFMISSSPKKHLIYAAQADVSQDAGYQQAVAVAAPRQARPTVKNDGVDEYIEG